MADEITRNDIYNPTNAELRLIEVLCNPEHSTKNVTEICKVAEISRDKYYTAMNKEDFKQLIRKTSLQLVMGKITPIINATIKFATSKANCSADRKILLQMAEMIVEKSEAKNINLNKNVEMSAEEAERIIAEYEKKVK